jgi:hypothetical protein
MYLRNIKLDPEGSGFKLQFVFGNTIKKQSGDREVTTDLIIDKGVPYSQIVETINKIIAQWDHIEEYGIFTH